MKPTKSEKQHGASLPGHEIVIWPIERLLPYARNPRKNDHVVDQMASAIREFGFKLPILARSNGDLIDGHLRLKAAHKLELKEVPVMLCDEWTDGQVKAFRLLANRSATWAAWDVELLGTELAELQEIDIDLALTGFDTKELDSYLKAVEHLVAGEDEEDLMDPTSEADQNAEATDPDHAVKLTWGRNKVAITPDEDSRLVEALKAYTLNTGLSYGFISWLLDGGAAELENNG